MSIETEITRLQTLRNALRTKLSALLGTAQTANFEECISAVVGIPDRGKQNGIIGHLGERVEILAGYHSGGGTVSIAGSEQEKMLPANIRAGVSLLGVVGDYSGPVLSMQTKIVVPATASQEVTPDLGFDGLAKVTVKAIPANYADISGVTAAASDVLATKIFIDSTGATKAGVMPNNGAVIATINGLATTQYAIPTGYHSGGGTVTLDNTIETALAAI